ncbi:MAG: AAA family ATPase [Cyanobacteria bacterium P01_F01_bin.86]
MKSQIIALFNQSGGVGKSTLTINLGYGLAVKEHRVLVVDMDPQGSLTTFMGLEPSELEQSVYNALIEEVPLPVHHHLHHMDLVAANIELSGAELELVTADMRDVRLKDALAPLIPDYDFILIDCPPSLGLLSYISLVAATQVLIPVQTEYKALKGTELLLNTIARVKRRANRALEIAGFIPTLHQAQTRQGHLSLEAIQGQLSPVGRVYPPVPRATDFANAAQAHLPLAVYKPNHSALETITAISNHLERR